MIDLNDYPVSELGKNFHIPPKPEILVELQSLIEAEEPDLVKMADLLANDVGLSLAVLKIINSAFYGMKRKITDIRQAAILLGPSALINLVTTYELRKALSVKVCISLERFWDCARDTANISTLVIQRLDLRIPMEDVYTAGLFHDCGIPVMALQYPDYQDVLVEANSNYLTAMTEIEKGYYGVHHSLMGYLIADAWNLPEVICQTILQNHERDFWEACQDPRLREQVAVLKMAENISDRNRRHCENPDWVHHKVGVMETLGVPLSDFKELENWITEEWYRIEHGH